MAIQRLERLFNREKRSTKRFYCHVIVISQKNSDLDVGNCGKKGRRWYVQVNITVISLPRRSPSEQTESAVVVIKVTRHRN